MLAAIFIIIYMILIILNLTGLKQLINDKLLKYESNLEQSSSGRE